MKKKVLAISLAIALIAIMVSGTLAYFTAEDKVENTFTIGSVDIEIWENGKVTDKETVTFEQPLLPVVDMDKLTDDPGYAAKVVKVENTGLNDAYIRLHIAVPKNLVNYLQLDANAEGWGNFAQTEATVDGTVYTVMSFDYLTAVAPKGFTSELLKGAYLLSNVDIKNNPATDSADLEFCVPNGDGTYTFSDYVAHKKVDGGYTSNTVSILVYAQAIQSQGFSDATTALNSGFGANTNPWQ